MKPETLTLLVEQTVPDVLNMMQVVVTEGVAAEKAKAIRTSATTIVEKAEKFGLMETELTEEVRELLIALICEMVLGAVEGAI
ncbi:hypothetical protein H0178_20725 [Cytobacillus firmus]|nr:hypothetical protein [Cytobacillus firmus]